LIVRDDAPTPVFRDIIDHPSAWTNASLGGKEGITYRLTEQQLVAFEEVIDRTRHLHPQEVSRRDFDHPVVNDLLEELREETMDGRGAALLERGAAYDRLYHEARTQTAGAKERALAPA
jgi:hypothetical protein